MHHPHPRQALQPIRPTPHLGALAHTTWRRLVSLGALAAALSGCGSTAGGGGYGAPAVTAGDPCYLVQGSEQCGLAGGFSSRLQCSGGVWIQLEACAPPSYCVMVAAGVTQCSVGGGGGQDAGAGSDAGTNDLDSRPPEADTGSAGDTGSAVDSSSNGDSGSTQDSASGDQDIGGGTQDTGGGTQDTGGSTQNTGDTTTNPTGWKSIVIYDKYTEPDCKATTSPGPDIDAVALWRNVGGAWKLMGVGKVGSANYSAGADPACPDNQHNAADDIAAVCGPLGDIDGKDISTGYLGLGGGSVELAIGACQSDSETVATCDGAGAPIEILSGDEIDVYEVDKWYLENGPTGAKADGATPYISGSCKCLSETYAVEVRKEAGKSGTDDKLVGEKSGTATLYVQ